MHTIRYTIKKTVSNNTYYNISEEDKNYLITKLIQTQSYMNELSITRDDDLKGFVKWYTSPNKQLPFSSNFKKHNSPQSFIAGMLNNMLYGNQGNITDTQANHLEFIINTFTQLSKEVHIQLQKLSDNEEIVFRETLLTF